MNVGKEVPIMKCKGTRRYQRNETRISDKLRNSCLKLIQIFNLERLKPYFQCANDIMNFFISLRMNPNEE